MTTRMYLILINVDVLKIREKKRMKKGKKDAQKHSINSVSIFNAFRFYIAFERIKNMKLYLLNLKNQKYQYRYSHV